MVPGPGVRLHTMTSTPTPDALTISARGGVPEATFEGRTFTFGGTDYHTPASLRDAALRHQATAKRAARDARFALALAERMEADRAAEALAIATQSRARAAATRAHRADPFGFKSRGL